jgi:hypothetical protein
MHLPTAGTTLNSWAATSDNLWGGGAGQSQEGQENWSQFWQILPFIEQGNIVPIRTGWTGWTPRTGLGDPRNMAGNGVSIPSYSCPSRGLRTNFSPIEEGGLETPLADFAGYHGSVPYFDEISGSGGESGISGRTRDPAVNDTFDWDPDMPLEAGERTFINSGIIVKGAHGYVAGPFQKLSFVDFGSISDGSSNTLLYGEKSADSRNYSPVTGDFLWELASEHYGFWIASGWPNMRTFNRAGIIADNATDYEDYETQESGGTTFRYEKSFGSAHPGTCNFVLGDGSTHAVSQTTSWLVLNQFGLRSDGTVIDVTEL